MNIAQQDATEIAMRNTEQFLKKNGILFLAIKARSIDVTQKSRRICKNEVNKLANADGRFWNGK